MCVSGPVLFPGGAHTHRIMLLEQSPEMQSYRLHLLFAFGLLEPLLRLSILFRAQLNTPQCAYGGPDRYRPGVQYVYAVPLNDLSILFITYNEIFVKSIIFTNKFLIPLVWDLGIIGTVY